jgi:murein DD-endopeptidase MepM/ murein hydrolase activator NlpD
MRKIIFKATLLVLSLYIISFLSSCNEVSQDDEPPATVATDTLEKEVDNANLLYGIDTTGYNLENGRIRRNQFLSEILDNYGITYSDLHVLLSNSEETLDVRDLKAGNSYTLFLRNDTLQKVDYFIYKDNPATSYIFDFTDSLHIRRFEKKVDSKLRYSSGIIESSLWNSMIDGELNPGLSVELSEIYAWTIDFFGLQKGDRYKIIYEEEYIDTISMGVRKIYGAWFQHAGTEFYAIPLIQGEVESYYDLEGNSLRKAFLKAPLSFSRISSRFSNSRMHPVLRIRRPHHGVDYAAAVGTPVLAIGDGRVTSATYDKNNGRIVRITHNSIYSTAYLHLSRFGNGIKAGKYVNQGDIIGYVGSSGLSTGPHLDFRFYKSGQAVDPLKVDAPPVEPVSEDNAEKFKKISSVIKLLLDSIN